MMCVLANAMVGCAASPADDRRRLSPTGLRDAGRDDDYDDEDEGEDEAVPPPRRVRDAGDARVGSATDAGDRAATRLPDAGTRIDASPPRTPSTPSTPTGTAETPASTPSPSVPVVQPTSSTREPPTLVPNVPVTAPMGDAQVTAPPRTRDAGSVTLPPNEPDDGPPPTQGASRDRPSRSSTVRCRGNWDCAGAECSGLGELACCRADNACGCRTFLTSCR
ncbi:MAG: hypothetical protein ABW252_18055 [Polyangiales bacterium]